MRVSDVSSDQVDQHRPVATRRLITRERLAELAAILERRIAERAVVPAALGVLGRLRAALVGRAGQ